MCLNSSTWINAQGAYNELFNELQTQNGQYWLKTNTPYLEVSTPVRLVFSNHCGPPRISYLPSFSCNSTLNASSPLFHDISNLTTELMSEVSHDVSKEPSLQLLSGESLSLRTCNRDDGARLDIKASGFLGWSVPIFFFWCPHTPLCSFKPIKPLPPAWRCKALSIWRASSWDRALALLCYPLLEAWVPPLHLLISVWLFSCPSSGTLRTVR